MKTTTVRTLTCRSDSTELAEVLLAGDLPVLEIRVQDRLQAGSYIPATAAFAARSVSSVLSVVQI